MVVACWWCNTSRGDRADDHWRMFLTVSVYEGEAEVKRQAVLARFDEATAAAFEITKSFR